MEILSHSPQETKALAQNIASKLSGGDILILQGDLGSGKTTFTQGLAEYFQIKKPVTSPTFVGMQLYDIFDHPKIKLLCHIDAYRFQSSDDVISSGIDEYLGRNDTLAVIEWPEKLHNLLKKPAKLVKFSHQTETTRSIELDEL